MMGGAPSRPTLGREGTAARPMWRVGQRGPPARSVSVAPHMCPVFCSGERNRKAGPVVVP